MDYGWLILIKQFLLSQPEERVTMLHNHHNLEPQQIMQLDILKHTIQKIDQTKLNKWEKKWLQLAEEIVVDYLRSKTTETEYLLTLGYLVAKYQPNDLLYYVNAGLKTAYLLEHDKYLYQDSWNTHPDRDR